MRNVITIPVAILICFAVGLTASYFQHDSLAMWYPLLRKPAITPPNIIFPIAWSIIYVCMGISAGLVASSTHHIRHNVLVIFGVQLFFNFMWSILFFYLRNPLWGCIDILLLDVFVVLYTICSFRVKRGASYLFIPYILWLIFATYLNGYVYLYN